MRRIGNRTTKSMASVAVSLPCIGIRTPGHLPIPVSIPILLLIPVSIAVPIPVPLTHRGTRDPLASGAGPAIHHTATVPAATGIGASHPTAASHSTAATNAITTTLATAATHAATASHPTAAAPSAVTATAPAASVSTTSTAHGESDPEIATTEWETDIGQKWNSRESQDWDCDSFEGHIHDLFLRRRS